MGAQSRGTAGGAVGTPGPAPDLGPGPLGPPPPAVVADPAEAAASADVLAALGRLPGKQRAAAVLFYFEDRPLDEIAELLDCSPSTAGVHLHRARTRLGELLGEEVVGDVAR